MFEFISDYETTIRRDRPVRAGTGDAAGHRPLNPDDARCYVIGEWLEHDNNWNFRRGGDNNAVSVDETARMCWPFFLERGRYDAQGIAGAPGGIPGKATVVYHGHFDFETDIMDITGLAVGTALTVSDVTIGGVVRRALRRITAAGLIVARVTFVDATAGTIRAVRIYS